jgi:hypothetical protein
MSKPDDGPTPTCNFRLGPRTLAELDALARAATEDSGRRESRTNVLRQLIHEAYLKLSRRKPREDC